MGKKNMEKRARTQQHEANYATPKPRCDDCLGFRFVAFTGEKLWWITLIQKRFLQMPLFSNKGGLLRKSSLTAAEGTVAREVLLQINFQRRFC
jgi:hypothetical protein